MGIVFYLLPQTVLGLLFASYQIAIQEIPGWNPIDMCGAGPNCADKVLIGLGPITIPMLAAAGFLFLLVTLISIGIHSCRAQQKTPSLDY